MRLLPRNVLENPSWEALGILKNPSWEAPEILENPNHELVDGTVGHGYRPDIRERKTCIAQDCPD